MAWVTFRAAWLGMAILPAVTTLPGCMPGEMSAEAAAGEPASGATISLSVHGDSYEIDRWYSSGLWRGKPLVVPRSSVPADCPAARFTLDDDGRPLRVAEPVDPVRVTAPAPPLPATAPACTLRVAYGLFDGTPPREGLVVTGASGVVAYAAREPAQPSYYALTPVEAAAEVWLFSLGMLASPVLLPVGMAAASADKKKRARAEAALPPEVAACWRAADALMRDGGPANPDRRYIGLQWASTGPEGYTLQQAARGALEDPASDVTSRVTLRGGRVAFVNPVRTLATDASVDCELRDTGATATAVRLRE